MLLRSLSNNRANVQLTLSGIEMDRYTKNRLTVEAFNQIAVYVASVKGRKNLLWFVPGIPVPLMRDGGYGWGNGDMGLVHRLLDVYELFTAEQIAVSPVDPRGVVGLGMAQLRAEAVAEQSGGEAFYNNNDLKSLIAKAINDGSQFYTLSYIPPKQKDDGHYHHIKIELVDQPSCTWSTARDITPSAFPRSTPPLPALL